MKSITVLLGSEEGALSEASQQSGKYYYSSLFIIWKFLLQPVYYLIFFLRNIHINYSQVISKTIDSYTSQTYEAQVMMLNVAKV